MNRTTFLRTVENSWIDRLELLRTKGAAYSGEDDAFANFKETAADLGMTKYQIWLVYFNKHISSIKNAIKADPSRPKDYSEGLKGRIDDSQNYLDLFRAMLAEDGLLEKEVPM